MVCIRRRRVRKGDLASIGELGPRLFDYSNSLSPGWDHKLYWVRVEATDGQLDNARLSNDQRPVLDTGRESLHRGWHGQKCLTGLSTGGSGGNTSGRLTPVEF